MSSKAGILALLKGIIKAVEDGGVAVEELEGKSLEEMAEISRRNWDEFDRVVEEGRKAGHENEG